MDAYQTLLRKILERGVDVATGAFLPDEGRRPHARCLVGERYVHDLRAGFPAVTTKPLFWKGVVAELLWFLRGETTLDFLHEHNVQIWNQWAGKNGHDANDVGPVYGCMWRRWPHADPDHDDQGNPARESWDQVARVVEGLKAVAADPSDRARRRLVVSAWNAPLVPRMGLAPCHTLWQAVPVGDVLHLVCHWRSIDMFFGFPFNLASYALLTHLLAGVSGLRVGTVTAQIADCHLYDNQFAAAREQCDRLPLDPPELEIDDAVFATLDGGLEVEAVRRLRPDQFRLVGYRHRGRLTHDPAIAE